MSTRRKLAAILLVIFAVFGLITTINIGESFFLRQDSSALRSHFLSITPIGSSSDYVVQQLLKIGYNPVRKSTGFFRQETGKDDEGVGVSSISTDLGDYWLFFLMTTNVTVFWGFDAEGKLIDIWVWKTTDAP